VKLAGFLSILLAVLLVALLAIPAFAQSSAAHGARIAQVQTAYLEAIPPDVAAGLEIADRFREAIEAGRSSGAIPAMFTPAPVNKGPRAEFETWVEQRSRDYAESVVTGISGIERDGGKATIHRFVRDNFRHVELTYTIILEIIPGAETFRVAFSDSTAPYPVPQILRDGETIALDLAVDAKTGRRLVDYIRTGTRLLKPRQAVARDVYADDAELTITEPRLRINGAEQPATDLPATVSTAVLSVDVPGQGRFALSFKPRAEEGFERAGEVTGNSLVFAHAGNIFRIDCGDRIATGSGIYNIYARKEPVENPLRFMIGSGR